MSIVRLRFYAELNEHLPPEARQVEFERSINDGSTVADVLAQLHVPADEVDLVLVNGETERLDRRLSDGDRVSVYPVFDAMDVSSATRIQHRPARRMRFVLDVQLGKLAHHLRMLGFDTIYRNDYRREELVRIAAGEDRILLTTSGSLFGDDRVRAGYRVRSPNPREQLAEILGRFDLWQSARPFLRCLHCNAVVVPVSRASVLDRLPEKVREHYDDFTSCPSCRRIYWKGTHVARMIELSRRLYAGAGELLPPHAL